MRKLLIKGLITFACGAWALAGSVSIGFVADTGGIDDKSFNQGTWEGVKDFARENGLKEGREVKCLQSTAEADYVPNLSALADQGMNLIIATGFTFNGALVEVAPLYPDQKFLIIDSIVKDKNGQLVPNVANAVFAEHEGSFLAGVAAGLKARAEHKDIVGFVGGMKFPLVQKFEAGYEQGVRAVAPGCKVLVDYAGEFNNPGKGQALASKQYGQGAYIIYQAAGSTGNGVVKEARERSQRGDLRWVIGTDKDHYQDGVYGAGKSAVLTSMLKRAGKAAHDAAVLARDGKFPGGQVLVFNLRNKGVGLPESNPNLTPDMLRKIAGYEHQIVSGRLKVSEIPAQ